MNNQPAIIILSKTALPVAEKISAALPASRLYAPEKLKIDNAIKYNTFSKIIHHLYKENIPLICLCASGIIIRTLAPLLQDKFSEPPVLAVAEDGSSVVPLLGANSGANVLARKIAHFLDAHAAITTSGELRFGINLLYPPDGLELLNRDDAKGFIAALLNGEKLKIKGNHPEFQKANLPFDDDAKLSISIDGTLDEASAHCLVYRTQKNAKQGGSVSVIGLGPGDKAYMTQSASHALQNADDILGYGYYIDMAGPFLPHQMVHKSDNREEIARAYHAFELAQAGRNVAIVSSGDPGIFAMAAAVMEAWESNNYDSISVTIEPGISAAMATAAKLGAPLGHDFALISLSDNLKPWDSIEQRLKKTLEADFVLGLYNPVSKSRPHQVEKAIDIIKAHAKAERLVVIAHDVARQDEKITVTTLGALDTNIITSRSVLLIGSSKTRQFTKNGRIWVYTPRSYKQ